MTTYGYNIRRLTSVSYPGGADAFTYDTLGRRITASNAGASLSYTYDALNRIKSVTNSTYNLAVLYDYDAAGNMLKMTTPAASGVTTYSYDAKNRLSTISDPAFGTFRFAYDPMDRRTSLLYPNGVATSYAYDNAYRITAIATKNALADVIDGWSYQYDAVGNRISKTDINGKAESYSYDNTYRLSEARYGDGSRESFTYDPAGNRLTRSDESGTTIQYSYDVANQLLSAGNDTFVYDGNGSATSKTTVRGTTTLVYDGQNRVTSIAGPDGNETSVWGPDGTRVRMNNATQSYGDSKLLYDLRGNAIYDAAGYTIYRVLGPGVDEVLGEHKNTNHTYYYHHDALGSVTAVTNESGVTSSRRSYRAFGQMTQTVQDTNAEHFSRYAFTGRELSVGAMMQYRSRMYDTSYGRFAQQDSHRGDELASPSLHLYVYVLNRPTGLTDPAGHESVIPFPNAPGYGFVAAFSAIVMMSAAVYGIAEAIVYALTENDVWSTDEFDRTMRYVGGIVTVSAISGYLNAPITRSILMATGLAVSTAYNAYAVLFGGGRYTICEKRAAFILVLLSMFLSTMLSWGQSDVYAGLDSPGYGAAATYLEIAILNVGALGGTFVAEFSLLGRINDPEPLRRQSCR